MERKAIFLVSFAGLIAGAVPAPASACSWLAEAIKSSLPTSGASDVPIDVAPIIRGHGDPNSLRWETRAGEPVPFDVKLGPSADFTEETTAELVPRGPLRPNTAYVIHARLASEFRSEEGEERLEFTTGVGTADADFSRPPALAATVLKTAPSQCTSHTTAGCIFAGDGQHLLEILDARGNALVRDVVAGDVLTYVTEPSCIRVSTRSASGRLSAATQLCGAELELGRANDELDGTHPCRGGGFHPAGPTTRKPAAAMADASVTPDAGTATSSVFDADLSSATAAEASTEEAATAAEASTEEQESGCTLASGRSASGAMAPLWLLLAASLLASRARASSRRA